jgi:hypothetical protein
MTGNRVRIRAGWDEAGKEGTIIGEPVFVGQSWTPVLWDSEEDPDFYKTVALEVPGGAWVSAKEVKP